MYGLGYCGGCEKFRVTIETPFPVASLNELPGTYDSHERRYVWKFNEFAGYALIPQSISGRTALLDLFFCVDGKDGETIDTFGYAKRFFAEHIRPLFGNIQSFELLQCEPDSPEHIACRRPVEFHERRTL
ncbi:MAG TPA: hypothetical protein VL633_11090 [Bacteroidota bacterium]|nr:hypothetical protein [Bacteroidota bacterium]